MVLIILGILMMAGGAGCAIHGVELNSSVEAQLTSMLTSGSANPGTSWIIIGVVVAIIGLILLIVGAVKKNK